MSLARSGLQILRLPLISKTCTAVFGMKPSNCHQIIPRTGGRDGMTHPGCIPDPFLWRQWQGKAVTDLGCLESNR